MGQVDARLPLALLRAVRLQDTPADVLPDEPVSSFFPQRLGLSDVVEDQIRQFEALARKRRPVDEERVAALFELIVRRMDAAAVLNAAGEKLARMTLGSRSSFRMRLKRRFPPSLRRGTAVRALRSILPEVTGGDSLTVSRNPLEVRAKGALTARVGDYGGACQLYSSTVSSVLSLLGMNDAEVIHVACQRHGDEFCVWRAEI